MSLKIQILLFSYIYMGSGDHVDVLSICKTYWNMRNTELLGPAIRCNDSHHGRNTREKEIVRNANIKWQQFIRLEQMALRVQLEIAPFKRHRHRRFSPTHFSPTPAPFPASTFTLRKTHEIRNIYMKTRALQKRLPQVKPSLLLFRLSNIITYI